MYKTSVKQGAINGVKTIWTLGKVIFPVTLFVVVLQHTPILPWVIRLIEPIMGIFGLSGDAAIPLVLGNFLNLYAGIAGIMSLDLTVKEVFIIAVMMSFSHNLFIESSVSMKVGVPFWLILTVRIGLAVISAITINLLWNGGQEMAQYGMIPVQEEQVAGVASVITLALKKAFLGVLQLTVIVMPLMIGIQLLKNYKWLDVFSRWVAPFTRMLGMKENTSTTMASGLVFGLAYGAGVMIQAVKEDGVSKRDVTLAFIFLVACHAVVEDTLIFVPLGIPVWPLLIIRLLTAIILTWFVASAWRQDDTAREGKVA
ncbi:putative membrane protein YvoD [Siminovitchia terrae]|uniref:nucleoside recognition domain-containing protein n=1 Tax=Siminovitchia terrae TaxID=1914933 RepID=UPI001B0217D2|nr:nucleoside recognition domain-containing protein [Siminovitchia terrae]GIN89152.1 putative membrane protein YvoD [Siminovitchia terrae]